MSGGGVLARSRPYSSLLFSCSPALFFPPAGGKNGGGGIRTPGAVSRTPVFKTGPFSRSGTPPDGCCGESCPLLESHRSGKTKFKRRGTFNHESSNKTTTPQAPYRSPGRPGSRWPALSELPLHILHDTRPPPPDHCCGSCESRVARSPIKTV